MPITVELSLYPLSENYVPVIRDFIARLKTYTDLEIVTNATSTQIVGEHAYVFEVLSKEISDNIYFRTLRLCNESSWF